MWSPLIIFTAIVFDDHSGFRQRPQLFTVQTFVTESAMKALYKSVLPGAARINVERLDLIVSQPALDCVGNELWPVVRTKVFRDAMFFNGLLQPRQHILGTQCPISTQYMTLTGVFIEDCQHLQGTTSHRRIGAEESQVHTCPRCVAFTGQPVEMPRRTTFRSLGGTRRPSARRSF